MFYDILDKKRLNVLPLLKEFKNDFYLAGGTGLALQIGHRDSIDFDFFSQKDFKTSQLYEKIKKVFKGHKVVKIQDEPNTLTVLLDNSIKISFFTYNYKLLKKSFNKKDIRLASIEDIACMKLSAVVGRATNKDYVDLYFILQKIKLSVLLKLAEKKFKDLDSNLILKSLVYFDDIEKEPIKFKHGSRIGFKIVEKFLIDEVKKVNNF